jgi:NAD(P)-dependent dehydrogenase (short-subunit alcohol dehydrogenase family)
MNKLKIAITGHSKGIGKALSDLLISQGHTVIGFSRSNGYNIRDFLVRKAIIEQSADCDIFINNAYSYGAQTELLKALIPLWEGSNKFIINIGSKVTLAGRTLDPAAQELTSTNPTDPSITEEKADVIKSWFEDYTAHKIDQLVEMAKYNFHSSPRMLAVNCGFVDTDMVKAFKTDRMSLADDVANMLVDIIKHKDKVHIQEITFDGLDIDYLNLHYNFNELYQWVQEKLASDYPTLYE